MEFFSLQILLLLFLPIFLFFFFNSQSSSKKPISSGYRTYPIVGNLPDFLKNRGRFLDWTTEVLEKQPTSTITFRRPGNVQGVITANPMNVEYVLKTKFENFPKGDGITSLLQDFLGQGIFNSDGPLWKVQRKTASFEFKTKSLRNFVMENVQHELQNRLLPFLQRATKTNEIIDLADCLERFAFDNICKLAFNEDPACLNADNSPDFAKAFEDAANLSAGRFMYALPFLYRIKKFLNIGCEKRLKEAISTVHDFATKIIRARLKKNVPEDSDLLSRFIANSENSEEFLRDIVVSFIQAGRDTTSTNLVWFFWFLASRPDVEEKILEELKSVRLQNPEVGDVFSYEELKEMHYLHAAISESLRLYPPVAVDTKECLQDDVLPDGTFIGKGWFITYQAYAMGRMKSIWGEDCRSFRPERWLENGVFRPENPFKFPAFHAGPRMCLGKDMAYLQMKSIVAYMLERFEINVLNKDSCPSQQLSLTLRMKGGFAVEVKEKCINKD